MTIKPTTKFSIDGARPLKTVTHRLPKLRWSAPHTLTLMMVLAISLTSQAVNADSGYATNCQRVANGAMRVVNFHVDSANFHANSQHDYGRRQYQRTVNLVKQLERDASNLVDWCNENIHKCKQNYVSWYLSGSTLTGVDWRASCAYGQK